jgi:hypothetical protein
LVVDLIVHTIVLLLNNAFGNGQYPKTELDYGITYLTETKDKNIFRFSSEEINKFWIWLIFMAQNY